jgi:hypothetical protein
VTTYWDAKIHIYVAGDAHDERYNMGTEERKDEVRERCAERKGVSRKSFYTPWADLRSRAQEIFPSEKQAVRHVKCSRL